LQDNYVGLALEQPDGTFARDLLLSHVSFMSSLEFVRRLFVLYRHRSRTVTLYDGLLDPPSPQRRRKRRSTAVDGVRRHC
jgi:hypothetical protein